MVLKSRELCAIILSLSFVFPSAGRASGVYSIAKMEQKETQKEVLVSFDARAYFQDNQELSENGFDYNSILTSPGKCKERDQLALRSDTGVLLNYTIAPCGKEGLVLIYQPSPDAQQAEAANQFLKTYQISTRKRISLPEANGTFVSPNYVFVAMGGSGLAVFESADLLTNGEIPFHRISFPSTGDVLGVAVLSDAKGNESYAYLATTKGIAVVPFDQIRQALKSGSATGNEIRIQNLPSIPVVTASGIDILREAPPAHDINNTSFAQLVVTTEWGQLRLYSLYDPKHPVSVAKGNIWTPFLVKRRKVGNEWVWDYRQHNTPLSGITILNPATSDILLTDVSGAAERMNIKEYILITSTTQTEIMSMITEKFGTEKAFWIGMLLGSPEWLEGYYAAFTLIGEGIVDQWLNPLFKSVKLPQVDIQKLSKITRATDLHHHPTADLFQMKTAAWRKTFEENQIMDTNQLIELDQIIESGKGNGRMALSVIILQLLQVAIASQTVPVIEGVGKFPGLTKKKEAFVWFAKWFGTANARVLNTIYSRAGVNMTFRPIESIHFWKAQKWAWVDAVIIAITTWWVRRGEIPEKQFISKNFADKTHFLFLHEQFWFDLPLNLILYSLLLPSALADKGKRGFELGFYRNFSEKTAKYLALNAAKFAGRYKGVVTVNFLIRQYGDFAVQVLVKKGKFGIPLSMKRNGFDMGYSPSWVIPCNNIAWFVEDAMLAAAAAGGKAPWAKAMSFASEWVAAGVHGLISGIPIEYGIKVGFDQPTPFTEKLEELKSVPIEISPTTTRAKP